MPVIVALLHDIVITIGVYSLTGSEVTTATVAAVLTVLGYSIYDTIIIFDRIRENIPLMRRLVVRDDRERLAVGDDPPLAGDDVHHAAADAVAAPSSAARRCKDFAFALIVGILSGAYSSIFIAAPLLTICKEREPEYRRRIGDRRARRRGRADRAGDGEVRGGTGR